MPAPARIAILPSPIGSQAIPSRGIHRLYEGYMPRGAIAGTRSSSAGSAIGTRAAWSLGIPGAARTSPLYGLPEFGTIVPVRVTVTACAGSYRDGSKLAILFADV